MIPQTVRRNALNPKDLRQSPTSRAASGAAVDAADTPVEADLDVWLDTCPVLLSDEIRAVLVQIVSLAGSKRETANTAARSETSGYAGTAAAVREAIAQDVLGDQLVSEYSPESETKQ
jgi:hypothetical protein